MGSSLLGVGFTECAFHIKYVLSKKDTTRRICMFIFVQLNVTLSFVLLQRKVEVSVVFLKIGEIDTLKEQYEADVLIQSKWQEPLLDKDKVQVRIAEADVLHMDERDEGSREDDTCTRERNHDCLWSTKTFVPLNFHVFGL